MNKRVGLMKALDLMRAGSVLVREHKKDGWDGEFFLVPGGPIERRTGENIQKHPQVTGGKDGMWPGYDQKAT